MSINRLNADLIIYNTNIITVNSNQPRAQAVAVKDGKFLAVGSNDDISGLRGTNSHTLNLHGKTVLPGFIDAHTHVLSSGTRHVLEVDCDRPSIPEIQSALRKKTTSTDHQQWVIGFKFDDTKTKEGRFLDRHDLDTVSTDHPIMVAHQAGHVYFFNSKGLEMAGFSPDTPDTEGGFLARESDRQELNGMVYGRAIERVQKEILPHSSPDDRRMGLNFICKLFSQAGLTSVHDAMVSNDDLRTYQEAKDSGELPMRVYLLMARDHFAALRDAGIRTGFGDEFLRIGGIKLVADGAISTRTAYMSQPYIGSACDHGLLVMDREETYQKVLEIHKAGFQICIHSNGDLTTDMVISAYENAQRIHPLKSPRHRIEHCSIVNNRILDRMKAIGCIATPFCSYVYYHGEKMKFYGEERLEWMFAQRSFIDNGIVSTGASDYPCSPFNPLMGIQSCVTRTDKSGRLWGPSQRISVEEALRIYTLNGAYASFEENMKGSIERGKLADMVVLSEDPTTAEPHAIKDIQVERTIVGGATIYEA